MGKNQKASNRFTVGNRIAVGIKSIHGKAVN